MESNRLSLHRITFDLSDPGFPEVTFQGGYTPSSGPLPTLHYPLVALWVYEGTVVKALFEANEVPVHEGEVILHRYEAPQATHQGQADYRYFTIPGHAGMILSRPGFSRAGFDVVEAWHHLAAGANEEARDAWGMAQDPDEIQDYLLLVAPDVLNRFPPVQLVVRPPEAPVEPPTQSGTPDGDDGSL